MSERKKVIHIDDLTPAQRNLVLVMIKAEQEAQRRRSDGGMLTGHRAPGTGTTGGRDDASTT